MTYDHWKTTEPDDGQEAPPEPTRVRCPHCKNGLCDTGEICLVCGGEGEIDVDAKTAS